MSELELFIHFSWRGHKHKVGTANTDKNLITKTNKDLIIRVLNEPKHATVRLDKKNKLKSNLDLDSFKMNTVLKF